MHKIVHVTYITQITRRHAVPRRRRPGTCAGSRRLGGSVPPRQGRRPGRRAHAVLPADVDRVGSGGHRDYLGECRGRWAPVGPSHHRAAGADLDSVTHEPGDATVLADLDPVADVRPTYPEPAFRVLLQLFVPMPAGPILSRRCQGGVRGMSGGPPRVPAGMLQVDCGCAATLGSAVTYGQHLRVTSEPRPYVGTGPGHHGVGANFYSYFWAPEPHAPAWTSLRCRSTTSGARLGEASEDGPHVSVSILALDRA